MLYSILDMEQIFKLKPNLTEATKRTYSQTFKRVVKYFDKPIETVTVDEMLVSIDDMIGRGENINTVKAFLNMCILFRQSIGNDTDKLIEKRDGLNSILNQHVKDKKKEKAEKLVDFKTLELNMEKEYDDGNWRNYIVQYLFLCFAFRNKDVNMKVVKFTKDTLADKSINYIVTNILNGIKLVINDYKTASTYGQKVIMIRDKKFIKVTRTFLKGKTWLLTDKDKPLKDESLATRIRDFTYERNTESNYFKAILIHANSLPHTTTLLKEYSKSRGTDINTILNSYDCDEKSI